MISHTPAAQGNLYPRVVPTLCNRKQRAPRIGWPRQLVVWVPRGQEGLASCATSRKRLVLLRNTDNELSVPRGYRRIRSSRRRSRGFTLIEMLVSLAITLIMMGAVVSLFGVITDSVSGSRAIIEMSERLRAARNRLQADLVGATATMLPPLNPANDEGYFEYIEGPSHDLTFAGASPPSMFGDADDVLMFTVRSRGEPFVGKFAPTATAESQVAEVMYFAVQNGPIVDPTATGVSPKQLFTLYRRVLLVLPGARSGSMPGVAETYYVDNDISARVEATATAGTYAMVPNSLGDLTKRENRFAHYPDSATVSFPFDLNGTVPTTPSTYPKKDAHLVPFFAGTTSLPASPRFGDDVLLTNVLAFDVQIYDPNAPIQNPSGVALTPTDVGFNTSTASTTPVGAYVDLGYSFSGTATYTPVFRSNAQLRILPGGSTNLVPNLPGLMNLTTNPATPPGTPGVTNTYDTWSLHYENDGVQQNTNGTWRTMADAGTNGLDDDNNGVVDDAGEFETQAPFAAQMRGIRVIIRVYEPSSQQVREVTVVQDFLPE